ncbi:MAG: sulfite exporter TauE/SafE family protein [Chloroflexota bacterium]|nr:sulfite exporter TauE/SafE family protein [Chloroflexota bacterium]MDE2968704.1 sulfite exporter TauE/SafE family protein [Chloroflexota bacterium]
MPIDTTLILVGLIIFIASAIKITFGVGFALIGTPLLLLVMEPNKVVGFIAPLILLQDMIILSQTWRHVPWRHAALLAAAAVVVAPFSAQLLTVLDPRTLQVTISSIIIVVGLALLAGLRLSIRREPVAMVAGGAVSGLVFPLSGISGPPVALLLVNQQWPVRTMRAVLAAYLVVLEIVTIAVFAINGVVNVESLVEGVFMLPFLGMSVVLSAIVLRKLKPEYYRRCVTLIVVVASLLGVVNLILS